VKRIRQRLTFANVMSSIAVFLVLGGGAAYATKKVGSNEIKGNSITTGKIKKEAVSAAKLKKNAVTNAKIRNGAVNSFKIASGTNLIATASGTIAATSGSFEEPATIGLVGTTTFTPAAGTVDQLNVEVRGNLNRTGKEVCGATVIPTVNGNPWEVSNGFIGVSSAPETPTKLAPNGFPLGGETGPVGLTTPGAPVTLGAKLAGDAKNCTSSSTVSVALAVTQLK